MVTPFDRDGEVDVGSARRLAARLVEPGSHGVVVAGTTGESPTLSDEEKLRLLEGGPRRGRRSRAGDRRHRDQRHPTLGAT